MELRHFWFVSVDPRSRSRFNSKIVQNRHIDYHIYLGISFSISQMKFLLLALVFIGFVFASQHNSHHIAENGLDGSDDFPPGFPFASGSKRSAGTTGSATGSNLPASGTTTRPIIATGTGSTLGSSTASGSIDEEETGSSMGSNPASGSDMPESGSSLEPESRMGSGTLNRGSNSGTGSLLNRPVVPVVRPVVTPGSSSGSGIGSGSIDNGSGSQRGNGTISPSDCMFRCLYGEKLQGLLEIAHDCMFDGDCWRNEQDQLVDKNRACLQDCLGNNMDTTASGSRRPSTNSA
jgi:hypothetical protein